MDHLKRGSEIIFTESPLESLRFYLKNCSASAIFFATEQSVYDLYSSLFNEVGNLPAVVIPSGESHKNMQSVELIWQFLTDNGADRKSLLVNMGGGMLTDLAGFAASTFKRGIRFINVPTTLLSQVDASVGGKTGINFGGFKNEIGTFNEPEAVIISPAFLPTLDRENRLSGFAEMIKHGLIFSDSHLKELYPINLTDGIAVNLLEPVKHSVEIKSYFVERDPTELNIRKALNFGHTSGHAIESMAMKQGKPVLHGYAVAWGMVAELFLSYKMTGFPEAELHRITDWIIHLYGGFDLSESDFDLLYRLMQHDKKNVGNRINFTLLQRVGHYTINQHCSKQLIFESLSYLKKSM